MNLINKYKPKKVEDFFFTDEVKETFLGWIKTKEFPNFLLHGDVGVGKSTLAKVFINSVLIKPKSGFEDFFYINASEKTKIEDVRSDIINFTEFSPMKGNKRRIIVLDEADNLSIKAQAALRGVIDNSSETCRFIFICNEIFKIHEALVSRCFPIFIKPKNEREIFEVVKKISSQENFKWTLVELKDLVNSNFPDIRRIFTLLENSTPKTFDFHRVREILFLAKSNPFLALNELISAFRDPNFSLSHFCDGVIKEISLWDSKYNLSNPVLIKLLESLGTAYERVKNGISVRVSFIYFLSLFRLL